MPAASSLTVIFRRWPPWSVTALRPSTTPRRFLATDALVPGKPVTYSPAESRYTTAHGSLGGPMQICSAVTELPLGIGGLILAAPRLTGVSAFSFGLVLGVVAVVVVV